MLQKLKRDQEMYPFLNMCNLYGYAWFSQAQSHNYTYQANPSCPCYNSYIHPVFNFDMPTHWGKSMFNSTNLLKCITICSLTAYNYLQTINKFIKMKCNCLVAKYSKHSMQLLNQIIYIPTSKSWCRSETYAI